MKFLIDMPVTPDAGPHLRAAGRDAVHAVDLGLARSSDNELLTVARRDERVIITADLDYRASLRCKILRTRYQKEPGQNIIGDPEIHDRTLQMWIDAYFGP